MFKVISEEAGAFYQHYPRTAAIVTSRHNGRKNAMAVAWHCPISFKPPLYGIAIAPKRFTYRLISESRQFALNFLPYAAIETIAAVGGSSGNVIDKFTEFDLAEDEAASTAAPVLQEAYAVYECRVTDNRLWGDHAWIIGEVMAVHTASNVFQENGVIDLQAVRPALYLGGDLYCSTDAAGLRFLDRSKLGSK